MANLYVRAAPTTDLNRNTEWFTYPGVWTIYIFILFFSWLVVLSVFGCSPGMAWTIVHLSHFVKRLQLWKTVRNCVSFLSNSYLLNTTSALEEQLVKCLSIDLFLRERYLIATHTTDYQHPMLFFNTLAVFVLVVAKFPHMHKWYLHTAKLWSQPPEVCRNTPHSLDLAFSTWNVAFF
ncbi:ORMDL family protein [Striga asiatica]|uniref:ORMDL family protein n=1 Tax=Striga asiatica TaxID=4170 RepID=A0A5A7NZR1_STRAF|nr:ORMDL family protein [Striga asiatica]